LKLKALTCFYRRGIRSFSLRFELDAPAACDHLAAHLAVFGRAEGHVWKVVIFD
jgi:hypothetical protein